MLRVRVERVVVTGDSDEGSQVGRGDGPSPRSPLDTERQFFEMDEFQDVSPLVAVASIPPRLLLHEFSESLLLELRDSLEPRIVEDRELEPAPAVRSILWHDPKVVTMVVVEDQRGDVIVGRRAIEPGYGLWCLRAATSTTTSTRRTPRHASVGRRSAPPSRSPRCSASTTSGSTTRPEWSASGTARAFLPGEVAVAGSEMLEVAAFPGEDVPELVFTSHRQAMRDWLASGEQSRVETNELGQDLFWMTVLTLVLVLGGGLLFGRTGLVLGLGLALVMKRDGLLLRDRMALAAAQAQEVSPAEAPCCTRWRTGCRPVPRAQARVFVSPDPSRQRVRDRPQPAARLDRRQPGAAADPRPGGAVRRSWRTSSRT